MASDALQGSSESHLCRLPAIHQWKRACEDPSTSFFGKAIVVSPAILLLTRVVLTPHATFSRRLAFSKPRLFFLAVRAERSKPADATLLASRPGRSEHNLGDCATWRRGRGSIGHGRGKGKWW